MRIRIASLVLCLVLLPSAAVADVGFVQSNIWVSKTAPIAGDAVTLYAIVVNSGDERLEGSAAFRDLTTSATIGTPRTFGLDANGTSSVLSVVWVAEAGDHRFQAQITDAETVSATGARRVVRENILSAATDVIHVAVDTDRDGITDEEEQTRGTNPSNPDTDGDGVRDGADPAPTNRDADGDGDPDGTDPAPMDPGVRTPPDTDGDGTPDAQDSDDDNDGLYDFEEATLGTNSLKRDTDGDGVSDKEDALPLDPKRTVREDTRSPLESRQPQVAVAAGFSPPSGDGGGSASPGGDGDPFDSRTRSGQALKVAATPAVAGERIEAPVAGARIAADETTVERFTLRSGSGWRIAIGGLGLLVVFLLLLLASRRRTHRAKE